MSLQNTSPRFVIIGFGNIGRKHASILHAHPDAQLAAVIDVSPATTGYAANLYNVPVFDSINAFISSGIAADVACICTPNGLHVDHAMRMLDYGLHVLVEKPIGLESDRCKQLLKMARSKDKEVYCVLQNRYSPPALLLKELVESNKLGRLHWIDVRCYWNRDERYYTPGSWRGTPDLDGGTLYTQFSHFVDLLYWLVGKLKVETVQLFNLKQGNRIAFEDTGSFTFRFGKKSAGVFTYSTAVARHNLESSFTIIGEKGTVKASGQYMEAITYFDVEGMEMPVLPVSAPANQYPGWKGSASNHAFVFENLLKALKGEPYEMASPREALEVVSIIEKVYMHGRFPI